jgi:hypothetical protein
LQTSFDQRSRSASQRNGRVSRHDREAKHVFQRPPGCRFLDFAAVSTAPLDRERLTRLVELCREP